jgi:glycosyltransferase involved in cell wall biosynthesis
MLDPWSLSQGRLKKKLYLALRLRDDLNRASAIHFTDETERDLAAPLQLKAPAIVERLIIELTDFTPPPPRGRFRSRFARQIGERPIVLFMSRIHPKKGLDLLIPAFSRLNRDAALVIAGPDIGGYQAQVEAMARQHGLSDRVLFAGMLYGRERAEALVDADLFVLPSYQENFGVVVIEALAVGTPVILSDQVNIHRQVTAAQVGEVVPTQIDALAQAVIRWTGDADLRAGASARATTFVKESYDRIALARRWIEHYQRIVQR